MAFVRRVKALGGSHTEMNFERKEDITIDGIVDHCLRYALVRKEPKAMPSSHLLALDGRVQWVPLLAV